MYDRHLACQEHAQGCVPYVCQASCLTILLILHLFGQPPCALGLPIRKTHRHSIHKDAGEPPLQAMYLCSHQTFDIIIKNFRLVLEKMIKQKDSDFLIVDTSGRKKYFDEALDVLKGFPVEIKQLTPADDADFLKKCRHADVIMVTAQSVTREMLPRLPECKGVVRYGTGLDRIDLKAAEEYGVEVKNVRGFCMDELADHAIAFYLSLARQITLNTRRVRSGEWSLSEDYPAYSLNGKTAGIIGMGDVGQSVAKRLHAFGSKITAFDPYCRSHPHNVEFTDLQTIYKVSDAVFLHCPLNDETYHMIGEREFSLMKEDAFLINLARGGVVDEAALINALEQSRIAGAGLDVLEEEPPSPDNPLLRMDNVLITPHVGAYSLEAFKRLEIKAFQNVAAILKKHM